jgi:hypothetical protein
VKYKTKQQRGPLKLNWCIAGPTKIANYVPICETTWINNGGHIVTGSRWGIIAEEKLFGLVQRIHSRVSAEYKQDALL